VDPTLLRGNKFRGQPFVRREKRVPIYDSTIIFHPQIEDAGFDGRIKGAVELIQRYGGTIVN
jgi:hypothetical protein